MDYNKLKDAMVDKKVSMRSLAIKIGMTPGGFRKMLEKKTMSVEVLEQVCTILKVSPMGFLEIKNSYTNEPLIFKEDTLKYSKHENKVDHLESIDRNIAELLEIVKSRI